MNNQLEIYTKVCLPCVLKSKWTDLQRLMARNKIPFRVFRTTYDQALHSKATNLWGNGAYMAFAVFPNGKIVSLSELRRELNRIDEPTDKLVKAGKAKPVRKGKKHDVRRLPKTTRPQGKNLVEDSPVEDSLQTKTR